MSVVLCNVDNVAEGTSRGFVVGEGASRQDVVVVRRGGVLRVYLNACPHQGTPLETFPDRFLSDDGSMLICSTHGARFRVEDGYCVSGPCEGRLLRALAHRVEDGVIVI